jgi:hypothetical protein
MADEMTQYERIEAAHRMEETDRFPVAPTICYMIPYLAGMSIKEMFNESFRLSHRR